MWLLVLTIAAAALFVVATRGSFTQLSRLTVTGGWMLAAGLGLQILLEVIEIPDDQIESLGYGLLMVSYALLLAFCFTNIRTAGFGLITLGIALNALVIGLNQGMPTIAIGNDEQGKRIEKEIEPSVKHRPERPDDLLRILDDRIVLPEPFDAVISIGDIVVTLGICELGFFASRRPRRRGRKPQSAATSKPRRVSTRSSAPSTRPS